ncbi:MAG TPA: hypothetical protein VHO48_10285, partial [Anaerolineaceae bacterium]|nr:hypothetical protein [Anaerolineaceae bacterium]
MKFKALVILSIFCFVLLGPQAAAAAPHAPDALSWTSQCVDCSKTFTEMTSRSLALDSAGHPHIAFGADHLYYAYHDGSTWHVSTVDSHNTVGNFTSIAIDSSGTPHIAYLDADYHGIKYARLDEDTQQWTTMYVQNYTLSNCSQPMLALDNSGNPHVLFVGSGYLQHAVYDAAEERFTIGIKGEAMDSDSGYINAAFDSNGRLHVSYYKHANNGFSGIKAATLDETPTPDVWVTQEIEQTGRFASNSLALDTDGHAHVAYYFPNSDLGALKVAEYTGSAWSTEVVESGSNSGLYPSLRLDPAGKATISFYDKTNGDLKIATRSGAAWQVTTVDSTGNTGMYTSLALDSANNPRVSYLDFSNQALKYTAYASGAWQSPQTVEVGGKASGEVSIAYGADRSPGIAYRHGALRSLLYAHWNPAQAKWDLQTVDSNHAYAYYTSLAYDNQGRPRIAAIREQAGSGDSTYSVVYAAWNGSAWSIDDSLLPNQAYPGRLALGVDSSGRAHLAFPVDSPTDGYRLRYALWNPAQSKWDVQYVETSPDSPQNASAVSMVLDGNGSPHLVFETSEGLFYARRVDAPEKWEIREVASSSFFYRSPVLAVDAANQPHVAYEYFASIDRYDLIYATWDALSSAWIPQTVDSAPNALDTLDLEMDPQGNPIITYTDSAELKIAYPTDSSWASETIPFGEYAIQSHSMAVDPA